MVSKRQKQRKRRRRKDVVVVDPDFAVTLKKIKRLHRAIHGMQTDAESWLMDSGLDQEAAKAEIKRLSERDGLTETEIALYVWACVTADLRESLDEKQKEALVPFIWRRLKLEHEQRVKELSDIMKSLTPQQRKVVNAKNRARLLRSERKKRNKPVS